MRSLGPRRVAMWGIALQLAACDAANEGRRGPSAIEQRAIAETITRIMREANDPSRPDLVKRLLSLYPASGRVVSANAGRATTSRDTIAMGIRYFWEHVGRNMREPRWVWDRVYVDVLSARAAVFTGTYHVPHRTPDGRPHVIAGAWTAVFERRAGRWSIVQEHLSDVPQAALDPHP